MKPNRSPYSEVLAALSAALLLPHRSHAQAAGYYRTVVICPLDDHGGCRSVSDCISRSESVPRPVRSACPA
jgi:hypothetical protein